MVSNVLIIANGPVKDYKHCSKIIQEADLVICADGGANTAKKMNICPDYIIGDLDSIESDILKDYEDKSKIIRDENQDKTDFELALNLAETFDPKKIFIIGAIGRRIDHTLANILSLNKIKKDIKTVMVDKYNTLELVGKKIKIKGKENETVSIIPLTDISNLDYNGFKWDVKNLDTKFGWFGISNKLEKTNANVSFSDGKLLVIRVKDK